MKVSAYTHALALAFALTCLVACAQPPRTCPPAYATAAKADDGTITLQSVRFGTAATQPRRAYPVNHPQYAQVLAHVGAIEPDTEKLVEDWPAVSCH